MESPVALRKENSLPASAAVLPESAGSVIGCALEVSVGTVVGVVAL